MDDGQGRSPGLSHLIEENATMSSNSGSRDITAAVVRGKE
jgi:hypothetical protein